MKKGNILEVATSDMDIKDMLLIVRRLAQKENLLEMKKTPTSKPPGADSPLYAEMKGTPYRNDSKTYNARKTFELFLPDAASKLTRKGDAKEFFQKVESIVPYVWGESAGLKAREKIRDQTPSKFHNVEMRKMVMPAEQKALRNSRAKAKVNANAERIVTIDAKQVYDIQSKLIQSSNQYDHVLACLIACGSRMIEILSPTYVFDATSDSKHEILLTGVAKGSSKVYVKGANGKDLEFETDGKMRKVTQQQANLMKVVRRPLIGNPTHMNPDKFLSMIKKIRKEFATEGRENDSITASFNNTLNDHARAAFDGMETDNVPHTSKMCRALYMTLAWNEYGQHQKDAKGLSMNQTTYLKKIIGHTSEETTRIYMRFRLKQETQADQTATVARLESKVEELQNTVAEVKEAEPRYEQARLMRKDQARREGDAAKIERLRGRFNELIDAGIKPTEKILTSLGYGKTIVGKFTKLMRQELSEIEAEEEQERKEQENKRSRDSKRR